MGLKFLKNNNKKKKHRVHICTIDEKKKYLSHGHEVHHSSHNKCTGNSWEQAKKKKNILKGSVLDM